MYFSHKGTIRKPNHSKSEHQNVLFSNGFGFWMFGIQALTVFENQTIPYWPTFHHSKTASGVWIPTLYQQLQSSPTLTTMNKWMVKYFLGENLNANMNIRIMNILVCYFFENTVGIWNLTIQNQDLMKVRFQIQWGSENRTCSVM